MNRSLWILEGIWTSDWKCNIIYHQQVNRTKIGLPYNFFYCSKKPPKSFYVEGQEYHRYTSKFHIDTNENIKISLMVYEKYLHKMSRRHCLEKFQHMTFLSFYVWYCLKKIIIYLVIDGGTFSSGCWYFLWAHMIF